jgi:hypothetical protein
MPPLAELYEHHATDCLRAADLMDDHRFRTRLLGMAHKWMAEAAQLRAATALPCGDRKT